MNTMGRTLIIAGAVMVVVGLLIAFIPKIPYLGKLPGDIVIRRENFSFYFPLTTCILVSAVITLALYLFRHK